MRDAERAVIGKRGEDIRRQALEGASGPLAVMTLGDLKDKLTNTSDVSADVLTSVGELGKLSDEELSKVLGMARSSLVSGGKLWFVDHAGCTRGLLGFVASHVNGEFLTGGFYPGRSLPESIRQAGFIITDIERFTVPTRNPILRPWVQGVAIVESRSGSRS